MSAADLKLDLINQISHITEQVKLLDLIQMLKFQSEASVYVTNQEEKTAILEAQNEIYEGKVILNADVQKEITEWLNK